jgi:uncharacterized protein YndB with AHSA1/START domain
MQNDLVQDALEPLGTDGLRLERWLDAPAATVWRWFAEPELRAQWFAGGTAATPGGSLVLQFDHDRLSTDDVPYPAEGACHKGAASNEHVLRFEPPHVLSFTWGGGKEGIVTVELFAKGERTRLVLTHTGISGPPARRDFAGGWTSHLTVLQTKLAGGSVRDFWALHARSKAEVGALLG